MNKRRSLKSIYDYVKKNFVNDNSFCTVENFPLIIGKDGITRLRTNNMKEVDEKDVEMIGETILRLFYSECFGGKNGIGIFLTSDCDDKEIQTYLNIYNKKYFN